MTISTEKKQQLVKLLRQKRNVDRFKANRSWYSISLTLGVCRQTLQASMKRPRASGTLTRDQIDWAILMRSEYKKHAQDFKTWSYEGIGSRVGLGSTTVERYNQQLLNGDIK